MQNLLFKFLKTLDDLYSGADSLFEKTKNGLRKAYKFSKKNFTKVLTASVTLIITTFASLVFFGLIPLSFEGARLSIIAHEVNLQASQENTPPGYVLFAVEVKMDIFNWGIFEQGAISDVKVELKEFINRIEGKVIYLDRDPIDQLSTESRSFVFLSELPYGFSDYEWEVTLYDSDGAPVGHLTVGLTWEK